MRSGIRLSRLFYALPSIAAAYLAVLPRPLSAEPAPIGGGESVAQALCRLITTSAESQHIPVEFLTRLIWQESSFRASVTSPAGAQGIAQFMPGTAQERHLDDPFDPEQAVPASAALLSELSARFGNLGLAAAAYNAGPNRVANWIAGHSGLPLETQDYVDRITGRSAEEWAEDARDPGRSNALSTPRKAGSQSCLELASTLRTEVRHAASSALAEAPFAPWGVQLAGNFSKRLALASFSRARASYAGVLGDVRPMIIGTRLRTRGTHARSTGSGFRPRVGGRRTIFAVGSMRFTAPASLCEVQREGPSAQNDSTNRDVMRRIDRRSAARSRRARRD